MQTLQTINVQKASHVCGTPITLRHHGRAVIPHAPYREHNKLSVPGSTSVANVTVNFLTLNQRVRRSMYETSGMRDMGCVAKLLGCGDKRPWLPQLELFGCSLVGSWGVCPSPSACRFTLSGMGERQRRSPIRWSSQMLSLKKSIPGSRISVSVSAEGEAAGVVVSALRCERRNMFDLPTMQGAMATVEMAV